MMTKKLMTLAFVSATCLITPSQLFAQDTPEHTLVIGADGDAFLNLLLKTGAKRTGVWTRYTITIDSIHCYTDAAWQPQPACELESAEQTLAPKRKVSKALFNWLLAHGGRVETGAENAVHALAKDVLCTTGMDPALPATCALLLGEAAR